MVNKEKIIYNQITKLRKQGYSYSQVFQELSKSNKDISKFKNLVHERYLTETVESWMKKGYKLPQIKKFLDAQAKAGKVSPGMVKKVMKKFDKTVKWVAVGVIAVVVLLMFALAGTLLYIPSCIDNDGDGYGSMGTSDLVRCGFYEAYDCDDDNSIVNPGSVEECDGIDNNCDDIIDENCGGIEEPEDDGGPEPQLDITYQCEDGIDNDGDGYIDMEDGCCYTTDDNAESGCSDDDVSGGVYPIYECNDGIDNDGDGAADFIGADIDGDGTPERSDACCTSEDDNDEDDCGGTSSPPAATTPECSDEVDNDGDSLIDIDDPDCHTDGDVDNLDSYDDSGSEDGANDEPIPVASSCEHFALGLGESYDYDSSVVVVKELEELVVTLDVDGTEIKLGILDYETVGDLVVTLYDTSLDINGELVAHLGLNCEESKIGDICDSSPTQCGDGIDNDGDGKIDFDSDSGCDNWVDNDEFDLICTETPPQCGDGIDNDGDGLVDYGYDLDCDFWFDRTEEGLIECTEGSAQACTSNNGCSGLKDCVGGVWGECEISGAYCDSDCDGIEECVLDPLLCGTCDCDVPSTQICDDADGCAGLQSCEFDGATFSSTWGECVSQNEPCDDNCDGVVDDCRDPLACTVCECTEGSTDSCSTVDGCDGFMDCEYDPSNHLYAWGDCNSQLAACDDNCDGVVDDCRDPADCTTCLCDEGDTDSCTDNDGCDGESSCQYNPMTHVYDWGDCVSTVSYCDTDCDGAEDSCAADCGVYTCECVFGVDAPNVCYNGPDNTKGVGICVEGLQDCLQGGIWSDCSGWVGPEDYDAVCDGLDSDCDGTVDEEFVVTATVCGTGDCVAAGELKCINGVEVDTCTEGLPTGDDRNCDGKDNDCDGVIDEEYGSTMTTCGEGECSATGTLMCVVGSEVDSCVEGSPGAEYCGDGLDNDCDGTIDENCLCTQYDFQSCYDGAQGTEGVGECVAGQQMCDVDYQGDAYWGDCSGQVKPVAEVCDDGKDNDCDGDKDCDDTDCGTTQICNPCELKQAYWFAPTLEADTFRVMGGDTVYMSVLGNANCVGKELTFEVWEKDRTRLFSSYDDLIETQTATINNVGNFIYVSPQWIAFFEEDDSNNINIYTENYFVAYLTSDPSEKIETKTCDITNPAYATCDKTERLLEVQKP
ncbi:hypothetical protein HOD38_00460 [archaeon]|nr:hypothetical protein [archaeon]MBT4396718.1 hypothetical protein [archaeon]MBT4441328.1 hypothetical protein [archaeon]